MKGTLLNLEDGCSTLTKFTAYLISEGLKKVDQRDNLKTKNYLVCGGGRKNKTLIRDVNQFMNNKDTVLQNIDLYDIDGDFVESQAFAYLAIRSYLKKFITLPSTTGVSKPSLGGKLFSN